MWGCDVDFCVMSCLFLASASVMYLHSKSIAHSDLKAANILIDGTGAARVADFGVRLPFPPIMICARAVPVLRYLYHLSAPSHLMLCCPSRSRESSARPPAAPRKEAQGARPGKTDAVLLLGLI